MVLAYRSFPQPYEEQETTMSNKGYVATAGGFCVAISSIADTEKTNTHEKAVISTNTAMESNSSSSQSAATCAIKKSA